MLFLCTFGIELHQADIDPRLADAIHPHVQVTANLIGGFHIPFDVDLGDGQLLPAQRPGGDVGQQLRCIDSARTFTKPFAVPPSPGSALSRCGASMVASRLRSFTPSSPLISALFGP
ncbi:Uncharacterised protein [Klebsiella pneumoniae subsp. rhinoscleromatis]|nr:Uncharacterised protein [Klebsiella pneumoniae subsp. rhinoscleromatis]